MDIKKINHYRRIFSGEKTSSGRANRFQCHKRYFKRTCDII